MVTNGKVILSEREREILKKFENVARIKSEEEWKVLKNWAKDGWVSLDLLLGTAKLTESGKKHLYQ